MKCRKEKAYLQFSLQLLGPSRLFLQSAPSQNHKSGHFIWRSCPPEMEGVQSFANKEQPYLRSMFLHNVIIYRINRKVLLLPIVHFLDNILLIFIAIKHLYFWDRRTLPLLRAGPVKIYKKMDNGGSAIFSSN